MLYCDTSALLKLYIDETHRGKDAPKYEDYILPQPLHPHQRRRDLRNHRFRDGRS